MKLQYIMTLLAVMTLYGSSSYALTFSSSMNVSTDSTSFVCEGMNVSAKCWDLQKHCKDGINSERTIKCSNGGDQNLSIYCNPNGPDYAPAGSACKGHVKDDFTGEYNIVIIPGLFDYLSDNK